MDEAIQQKTCVMAILSLVFGCLFIIPLLGFIFSILALVLGIVAVVKISKKENNLKGEGLAISGIVLGAVGIIIIPIIALLAAIAIPNLLMARRSANDAAAKANVRTISTAIETCALVNNGNYPTNGGEITQYFSSFESLNNKTVQGYSYFVDLSNNSYKVVAKPETCGTTGTEVVTAEKGGVLQEEECK